MYKRQVKYYALKENPCHKAGSMGKKHADEMLFWTKQEFQTFIEVMKDRPASYTVFMTMYYTGIREGELLALTPSDIDFEKKTLTVNKSYQRLGREDIITTPKTPKSIRTDVYKRQPFGWRKARTRARPSRWGCQRNNQRSPKTLLFVFRRFACRPFPFLAVRCLSLIHI